MKIFNKYQRVSIILNLILCSTLLFSFTAVLAQQDRKPNIILIMADDLGYECITVNGGSSYHTPYIDTLANAGVRFTNCHSQPLCTPSRVQIMTGKYNIRNYTRFGELDRGETTFGNILRDAGYRTVIAGKWQLGKEKDSPQHFGFEESCLWQQTRGRTDEEGHDTRFSNPVLDVNGKLVNYSDGEYGPDIVSDFICGFIDEHKNEPFFAYYPMILTHCPFVPTPDSEEWDPDDPGSLSYKGDPQYFGDMVAYMDKMVGKIVSTLDEHGLRENTFIIFTGDNGTDQPVVSILNGKEYPGGKGKTTDNGTHVPLVVNWPGKIHEGAVCPELIDFSDILPTICDVAGVSVPEDFVFDGRSFLPAITGKRYNKREWIYAWYNPRGQELKEWARDEQYKLYSNGEFYDVTNDFFEENPLDLDLLSRKEVKAFRKLNEVLRGDGGRRTIDRTIDHGP